MDQSNNEYVIKVKDVLYVILKKLWIMLLVGVIAGGALFTYYFRQVETVKTNDVLDITKKLNAGESDINYQFRVQQIERARVLVEMIDNTYTLIDYGNTYLDKAIFMQIDPDNNYVSYAQFTITIEGKPSNGIDSALLSAYERGIRNGDYLSEYASELGTDILYIKELFSISSSVANNIIINPNDDLNSTDSFYISVYGPSREFVDDTMDRIISEVYHLSDELSTEVTPHKVSLVGIQKVVVADNSIREQQYNRVTNIHNLQDQIVSYNNSLDAIAIDLGLSGKADIIAYLKTHDVVYVDGVPTEVSETVINKKAEIVPNLMWFGIGFGGGALLVAIFVAIGYVFGKKVLTQAQFFGLFRNIRRIGVMKPLGKRSWFTRFIDVKTEDDTKTSIDNCNGLISANYLNLTKDLNKVLITGTGDKKAMNEAYKALGLKGDFKPDIFSNPDVLKTVPDYDGIVIIEQRKVSLKPVIENEIALLSNGGTKIIGAIII